MWVGLGGWEGTEGGSGLRAPDPMGSHPQMRCCGVTDYTDWYPVLGENMVPDRCCMENFQGCGRNTTTPLWRTVRLDAAASGPSPRSLGAGRCGQRTPGVGHWGLQEAGLTEVGLGTHRTEAKRQVDLWAGDWTHSWECQKVGVEGGLRVCSVAL